MEHLFGSVYKNKKVLITGHTGFKGSWLALWLSKLGAEVIGYSKDIPTNPNHFELLKLNITSITGDILDTDKLTQTVKKYKPDIVFHLAAQALVRASYAEPIQTYETNVIGTLNVLEACRKAGSVKAVVNVTSDKCYKNNEDGRAYKEDDPMGGDDPYSASKGAAEIVSQAYRKSFFNIKDYGKTHTTLMANVRAGNVIGGGDWAQDRLIPDLMKAAEAGTTVPIRSPKATRPWQHVLEPLSGYLLIGAKLLEENKEIADNWNFGPNDDASITVLEVVEHIKKYWDAFSFEIKENTATVHEAKLLRLDSSKARDTLAWKSVWNSNRTFQKTTEWYKKYYTNKQIISEQDLNDYINDAERASLTWTL